MKGLSAVGERAFLTNETGSNTPMHVEGESGHLSPPLLRLSLEGRTRRMSVFTQLSAVSTVLRSGSWWSLEPVGAALWGDMVHGVRARVPALGLPEVESSALLKVLIFLIFLSF